MAPSNAQPTILISSFFELAQSVDLNALKPRLEERVADFLRLADPLDPDQLASMTAEVIKDHRGLLRAAEAAYEAWMKEGRTEAPSPATELTLPERSKANRLYEAYVRAMTCTEVHMKVVSELIDRLGHIPKV